MYFQEWLLSFFHVVTEVKEISASRCEVENVEIPKVSTVYLCRWQWGITLPDYILVLLYVYLDERQ